VILSTAAQSSPIIRDLLQPALQQTASAGWAFLHSHDAKGRIHTLCSMAPCVLAPCLLSPYLHPCRVTSMSCLPCSLPSVVLPCCVKGM
jgi:hypothetical protein